MANNVAVTAGTGTTMRTDDVAGVHYPYVKLASGTEDATDLIAGDATNGLDVDVTRVIPGTSATHLGKAEDAAHTTGDTGVMALAVRTDTPAARAGTDGDYIPFTTDSQGLLHVKASRTVVIKPTLTISTSAYTAGDTLAGEITLTNAMRVSGGSGVLTDLILTDADSEGAAMQVLIFDSDPASTSAANDAFAWGAGDLARLLGVVVVEAADWLTIGTDDVAHITGINMAVTASGSANLFAHILTTGTPTYTATSDVTAAFKFLQD